MEYVSYKGVKDQNQFDETNVCRKPPTWRNKDALKPW